MAVLTVCLPRLLSGRPVAAQDVFGISYKLQVLWVAAKSIIANIVVKNGDVFPLTRRDRLDEPGIDKSVDAIALFIDSNAPVATRGSSVPNPAIILETDLSEYSTDIVFGEPTSIKHRLFHTQDIVT